MKSYLRFLAAAAAVMAVLLVLLCVQTGSAAKTSRDTVLLNDIAETVREHLSDPESLSEADFGVPFLVYDANGGLLYAAPDAPAHAETASAAMQQGLLCLPIHEESRYLGSVALPDPVLSAYDRMQRRLLLCAVIFMGAVLLVMLGIGLYVRRRIVVPFRRMRKFADRIAQGVLDDPLLMEQDNLFGSFTESFDIMREELRAARRREEHLRLREKELAASLGHDIKTPVTGIKLICELLSVKTEDAYLRGKIGIISQKAEQIDALASNLLSEALEELGEMQVQCQDHPADLLRALLAVHDTRGLVTEETPPPECLLSVDKNRLSQVIGNVLSNSYKYAGTPISVRYAFAGQHLCMEIADSGGGVPEEELGLITGKFYRGKRNSGGKEGSGLGLYIASELMRRMEGALQCENRSGGLAVTLMIRLS